MVDIRMTVFEETDGGQKPQIRIEMVNGIDGEIHIYIIDKREMPEFGGKIIACFKTNGKELLTAVNTVLSIMRANEKNADTAN